MMVRVRLATAGVRACVCPTAIVTELCTQSAIGLLRTRSHSLFLSDGRTDGNFYTIDYNLVGARARARASVNRRSKDSAPAIASSSIQRTHGSPSTRLECAVDRRPWTVDRTLSSRSSRPVPSPVVVSYCRLAGRHAALLTLSPFPLGR